MISFNKMTVNSTLHSSFSLVFVLAQKALLKFGGMLQETILRVAFKLSESKLIVNGIKKFTRVK